MAGALGGSRKAITVEDVGLVQGLLVVAQQLKKYAADGLQTNGWDNTRSYPGERGAGMHTFLTFLA